MGIPRVACTQPIIIHHHDMMIPGLPGGIPKGGSDSPGIPWRDPRQTAAGILPAGPWIWGGLGGGRCWRSRGEAWSGPALNPPVHRTLPDLNRPNGPNY